MQLLLLNICFLLILVLYQFLYSYLHCLVILSIVYEFYTPFNSLAICLHSIATSKSFLFIYFPDLLCVNESVLHNGAKINTEILARILVRRN